MTGFGAGRARAGDEELSVEIRSVNHKFCEAKIRLPMELASLEADLSRQIKDTVRRGALEVFVRRTNGGKGRLTPKIDLEFAREYVAMLDAAAKHLGLTHNMGTAELAQIEGLVTLEERSVNLEDAKRAATEATALALKALVAMREKEGKALAADLTARVALVRAAAERLKVLSPATIDTYRQRLEERIAELSKGLPVEPQRLAQEVAYFAERVDVAEELTRLASHLEQFDQLINGSEPAGRKMDFMVQELNREVNTTGSKSQSAELAQLVVGMKTEVERIREQVQNVE